MDLCKPSGKLGFGVCGTTQKYLDEKGKRNKIIRFSILNFTLGLNSGLKKSTCRTGRVAAARQVMRASAGVASAEQSRAARTLPRPSGKTFYR